MGTKRPGADEPGSGDSTVKSAPEFDTVRKGYRPDQVDTAVRELRWRLEMAERSQREAEERAASLTVSLEAARASSPDTFGIRTEKILRMAEHDAAQRRQRAVLDADRIIDDAHDEAERVIAAAHAEAERTRTDADAAVEHVHAGAATARRETDLCADTAAAMHQHVIELHGAVRGEVARLHAAMGAELRVLDEMVATPAAPSLPPTTPPTTPTVALPEQRPQPSRETTATSARTETAEPAGT